MGAVGVLAAFESDSHSLDTVLLVFISNHHCLFAEHHVSDAVSVIAHALVAI